MFIRAAQGRFSCTIFQLSASGIPSSKTWRAERYQAHAVFLYIEQIPAKIIMDEWRLAHVIFET